MKAGLPDRVWGIDEIAALIPGPKAKKRGPYKKHSVQFESANLPKKIFANSN